MKKIFLFTLLFSGLALFGCKEPEIIPAPSSTADLKIHFEGIINGSDVEWTKNVNKYVVTHRKQISESATPGQNDLAYYCGMKSSLKISYIEIGLGSLLQDPSLGTSPNLTTMRAFMDANLLPSYSDSAKAGFDVIYNSEDDKTFYSDETQPATVEFLDLVEKEDNAGEYIQFVCKFSCPVYWTDPADNTNVETAIIQNATMTGYFTR